MLRLIQTGNSLPFSFPVDPSAEFMPGMGGQLSVLGNNIVCGVSDGTCPIGIIDDIRTKAFTAVSVDEVVIAGPIVGTPGPSGGLISTMDVKMELEHAAVIPSSFRSDIDCQLIAPNGVIKFLAGTPLNFDANGDGIPDSIRTFVSYTYQITNIPGDDSTAGTGKVTIWFQKFIGETDQYDTTQRYPINANLYINHEGKFTTNRPSENHPGCAITTGTPTSILGSLQFLWL